MAHQSLVGLGLEWPWVTDVAVKEAQPRTQPHRNVQIRWPKKYRHETFMPNSQQKEGLLPTQTRLSASDAESSPIAPLALQAGLMFVVNVVCAQTF